MNCPRKESPFFSPPHYPANKGLYGAVSLPNEELCASITVGLQLACEWSYITLNSPTRLVFYLLSLYARTGTDRTGLLCQGQRGETLVKTFASLTRTIFDLSPGQRAIF